MPFPNDPEKEISLLPDLPAYPSRIISLVPSQSELLFHLGLGSRVIGITKFCIHPDEWRLHKTKVGGTKNIRPSVIRELRPDLIIANKEENEREQLLTLKKEYPVWITDITDLPGALSMIRDAGRLTGTADKAIDLEAHIRRNFQMLDPPAIKPLSVAYLIWRKPYMAAGSGTFIHDMLQRCGFINAFGHLSRYPEVSVEQIVQSGCNAVFFASEPYPFKQQHIDEFLLQIPDPFRLSGWLVDGELFSWYGSRLILAPEYFKRLKENVYRQTLAGHP